MDVWFSTPAYKRFEMSELCFAQRKMAIEKLEAAGLMAHCVVIANDENLDLAQQYGFDVVERDNEWLGRRFNDGYEYAVKQGATHVFPIGSDSWCDPQFIIDYADARPNMAMPTNEAICSRNYYMIDETGTRGKRLWVPVEQGVHFVVPAELIEACGFRPCQEEIKRGCDGSAWQKLVRAGAQVVWSESHGYENVRFESWPQVSQHDKLGVKWGVLGSDTTEPFGLLRGHYPDFLVDQMVQFYNENADGLSLARHREQHHEELVRTIVHDSIEEARVPTSIRGQTKVAVEIATRKALAR